MTVYPAGGDYPQVAGDVELVWQTVLESFTFLADDVLAQFDACPEEASPYADASAGYCLRYPSRFRLMQMTDPRAVAFVDAPMHVSEGQVSLPARLSIETAEVAPDRTLPELIDGILTEYPDAEIRRRPIRLGGEATVVVEGLSGRTGSRQLFALRNGTLYRFTLSPTGDDLPGAVAAAEGLWKAVTDSFTFLPGSQ